MCVIFKNGIAYNGSGGSGGDTSDYTNLMNKPRINGVVLAGNKTPEDLNLADGTTIYVNENNAMAVGVISYNQIQALFA